MIAKTLISNAIPPLKTTDTGDKALNWMNDFHVSHLPIVHQGKLVGLVSEDDIFDLNQPELPLSAQELRLPRPYVASEEHLYEVIKIITNQQLSILPVVETDFTYLGVITHESVLTYFAQLASLQQPGGVLVLEVNSRDYSMSEIARIVESENTTILSSLVTSTPQAHRVEVTLKLNRNNLGGIINTFQRFNYEVKASFQENDYFQGLQDRYDSLMKYLNV